MSVLTADSPTGPWTDPLGKALITRATPNCSDITWLFDPAVMVDDNGTGYLCFGGGVPDGKDAMPGTSRIVKLGDDMISLAGTPVTIEALICLKIPASTRLEIRIIIPTVPTGTPLGMPME